VARRHGRNGRVYLALASAGTAEPLNFTAKWTFNAVTDKDEVSALGDTNKIYVAGLPDSSGDFSGFYDDSDRADLHRGDRRGGAQVLPVSGYRRTSPTKYWFGTVFPDYKAEGDVGSAVKVSGSWVAASSIISVGLG
jgi:hypothetical protein